MDNCHSRHLIIGGNSQDGRILAEILLKKGFTVIRTSRSYATIDIAGSREYLYKLEPTNCFELVKLLERHHPEHIYLLSAQSSVGLSLDFPGDTLHSNTGAVIALLEAIRYVGYQPKIFYPLSTDMFGDCCKPATEESKFGPVSPYAISKLACLNYINYYRENFGMRIYTAFLSNHESVFRSSHFVTHKLVLAALNASKDRSFKIPVGCLDIVRDWGWASEYMHYVLQIINLEKPNDIIIATGTSFTLRQFADEIFSSFGLKYNDHLLESESLLRPNEIKVSRLDPSKLKSVIGSIPKINTPQVARLLIRKYVDLADAQKL